MAAVEVQEIRAASYVGFDSITQQIEHKLLKRGFQFNVMVVGTCFSVPRFRLGIAGAGRDIDSDRSGPFQALGLTCVVVGVVRPDGTGQVDAHQHHLCVALD